MSNYNFNIFVGSAQEYLSLLKEGGTYISLLAGSGLSEKDIKRAVKVLANRGVKVTYSQYHREQYVALHLE